MSGTEGLGAKLSAFAKTGGQNMNIAIYQKGKSFTFSVTKEPIGPFALVSKIVTTLKEYFQHRGKTKLDSATTVLVLARAAELAENKNVKAKAIHERIDPIACALLQNVKGTKADVLHEAGRQLGIKENIEVSMEAPGEKRVQLREEVSEAIWGLTTLQDREYPSFNVQEAVPGKANDLIRRRDEVLPSGVQDLWRGATNYKIMQQTPDGQLRILFDGAKKRAEMAKASKSEQSEECAKEIIKLLADRMLPGEEERSKLADSLALAVLNTDGNALQWGRELQKLGFQMGSFDALLAAMSQKLYLQATGTLRMEYGITSQGRDFNLIDGDKSLRKYEVTFLANGNIQIKVLLPYEMRAKPQEGEDKGQKLAAFNYVGTWEFDDLMNSCLGFKADVENLQMQQS